MRSQITVVIADDHPIYREGLKQMLEKETSLRVVGEAINGKELVELVDALRPHLVLADIEMPEMNGIEAAKAIKLSHPATAIIALTSFSDDQTIVNMLKAGATGYLHKIRPKDELLQAIACVLEGGEYFCNTTTLRLTKLIIKSELFNQVKKDVIFTDKEIEIIKLICEQHVSKEIADMTSLAHRTVEKYRDKIMEKTGSRNLAGIVVYAMSNGIYKP